MPSSTNWSSDWLLPVSTLSLLRDSATAGRTIQLVSVEPAACAAYRADTNASRLVRLALVSTVVYSDVSIYNIFPHKKRARRGFSPSCPRRGRLAPHSTHPPRPTP